MNSTNAKTITALLGAVTLAASAGSTAMPLLAEGSAQAPLQHTATCAGTEAPGGIVKEANVEGVFGFDQEVLSSTADISTQFSKAAAVLCANMPAYFETVEQRPIAVGGDVDASFNATLSDLADEEGTDAYEMACSCASNVAGGGAIANAEVEGVSLASLANRAQAR